MRDVVVASGNQGKLSELAKMLEPLGWRVRSQGDLGVASPEETGLTFIENAMIKARHAAQETGHPALADDSGIVVEALAGRPGIHSSRFAGETATDGANVAKLLADMADVAEADRGAFFYCALVLMGHAADPCPVIAEGRWHGRIAQEPSGSGGFGYDPVFLPAGENRTAAELEAAEKARLSHR
ncbi:MAG: RdgB/HAM1 family non-canonical purine NTP pyrophosphatase, partial [Thiohalorhabdaceae bacterium]